MPKNKKNQGGLGSALKHKLERKMVITQGDRAPIFYQESQVNEAEKKKQKMKSVLEQNNLAEYLQVAQLSQQDFHANRNIKFSQIREEVKNKKIIMVGGKKRVKEDDQQGINLNSILKGLQVPRRPNWHKVNSKDALQKCQNQAYLTWRRTLAQVQENNDDLQITPYEKNLQVWRQLWRVVERSKVLVQIIDGRNPLFFYSADLFQYAREVGKDKFLLVINKSDLVPLEIRQLWNKYFKEQGINHCFFTAKEGKIEQGQDEIAQNTSTVLSPHQLVILLQQYVSQQQKGVQIGLTGYPNVGKSSVINALLGRKKVGVASMPGKTKHFQTLKLTEEVTLCDCPGLVFPKVHASKAEMILSGLYPIDTLKEYEDSIELMAGRVPQQRIEEVYAIHWTEKQPYDGESMLIKYAKLKGFFGGNGQPNQALSARYILKDYVNGILVYPHSPPGQQPQGQKMEQKREQKLAQEKINYAKEEELLQANLDSEFFEKEQKVVDKSQKEVIDGLTQEDFLDIVEGRKLEGFRVTKEMRKDIKFAMKRGVKVEQLRKILMERPGTGHRVLIKS